MTIVRFKLYFASINEYYLSGSNKSGFWEYWYTKSSSCVLRENGYLPLSLEVEIMHLITCNNPLAAPKMAIFGRFGLNMREILTTIFSLEV